MFYNDYHMKYCNYITIVYMINIVMYDLIRVECYLLQIGKLDNKL